MNNSSSNPVTYDRVRIDRLIPILVLETISVLILTLQMSAVFVSSHSVLMPKFARSNILPVIITLAITAVTSFALFLLADCSIVASLGLCGAPIFVWAVMVRVTRGLQKLFGLPLPGLSHFSLAMTPLFLIWGLVGPLFSNCGNTIDLFLEGSYSWVAGIFLIGSVWGVYDLIAWHIGLRRGLDAVGAGDVTFSMFDNRGFKAWNDNVSAMRVKNRGQTNWLTRLTSVRTDRFIEGQIHRETRDPQMLWRICHSQPQLTPFLWIAFISVIGFAALFPQHVVPRIVSMTGAFHLFGLVIFFGQLWQHRYWHEIELLRPITRRTWASTWFRGVATEIAPILIFPFATGVLMLWSGQPANWTATRIVLVALLLFGFTSVVIAVGMWTLTLRPTSAAFVCMAGGAMSGVLILLSSISMFHASAIEVAQPSILGPSVVGLLTVAALFFGLAWWRWQNWEVGDVG